MSSDNQPVVKQPTFGEVIDSYIALVDSQQVLLQALHATVTTMHGQILELQKAINGAPFEEDLLPETQAIDTVDVDFDQYLLPGFPAKH